MKIKLLKTGEVCDVNESYGARLIEQGKAVIDKTPASPKFVKPAKKAEPETTTKSRKGE